MRFSISHLQAIIFFSLASLVECQRNLSLNRTTTPFDERVCGLMSAATPLVQGGQLSDLAHFPWLAAILVRHNDAWLHTGAGSLISSRHVIVRARAVSTLDTSGYLVPMEPHQLRVHLGSLDVIGEEWLVTKVVNHPFAKRVSQSLYVNAISVLETEREVEFSTHIRPVCLWHFIDNPTAPESAYVAGYGVGPVSAPRKHVRVTVQTSCDGHFEAELKFANETNLFCVRGDEGGGGPCVGDNQLFTKVGGNWYLRGFVSAVYRHANGQCNTAAPTLCEDIQQNILLIRVLML